MKINNIHDKYLKNILSDINIAKNFLSSFLPANVLKYVDINTLQYAKTDFILQDLKEVFSDMVFTVSRKDDEEAYISIVLEHKSQPDKFTAVQLLLYVAYGYYKQYKNSKSLKLILPVVFYHGKRKWIFKPVEELIDNLPLELKQYVPVFKALFIDLSEFSDEELNTLGDSFLTAILLLGKYAFRPDELEKKLGFIYEKLNSASNRNLIFPAIVYSMTILKIEIIMKIIKDLPLPLKSDVMTAYDTLIKEGMEKGLEQKTIEVVLNGRKNGIPIDILANITSLSEEKIKKILKDNGKA